MLGPSGCGKTTLLRDRRRVRASDAGRVLLADADITARRAPPAPAQHGLPAPDALPAPRRRRKRRVRPARRGRRATRAGCAGRRGAAAGAAGGLRQAARRRALGRPDAARRARPRARQPAPGPAARRAALGARPQDPAGDGGRAAPHPPRVGRDVRVRHARPAGGACAVRPRSSSSTTAASTRSGTPDEIYHRPASPFAARFVGDANVLPVQVTRVDGDEATVVLGGSELVVEARGGASAGPGLARGPPRGRAPRRRRPAARNRARRRLPRHGIHYQLDVPGLGEPFKAEVSSEGQAALLPIGSEVGLRWDPGACVLLEREEKA